MIKTKREAMDEARSQKLFSFLKVLYLELKDGVKHLALYNIAGKHNIDSKIVSSMLHSGVIKKIGKKNDKRVVLYKWCMDVPSYGMAEKIVKDVRILQSMIRANKHESKKFDQRVKERNLSPLTGLMLDVPSTIQRFCMTIYEACKDGINQKELFDLAGKRSLSDFELKNRIIKYLIQTGCILEEDEQYKWNDGYPDLEFASAVIKDIKDKVDLAEDGVSPKSKVRLMPKHRKTSSKENMLRILHLAKTNPIQDPVTDVNSNIARTIRQSNVIQKIGGRYKLNINDETLEEVVDRLYEDLKAYQRRFYKKPFKQPDHLSFQDRKTETEKLEKKMNLNETFEKMQKLVNLKNQILDGIRMYQKEIKGTNIEDDLKHQVSQLLSN